MGQAEEAEVEAVVAALRAGEVVLLPTDTVYGIAALPSVAGATARLFDAKDRSEGQPLAVLVASSEQAFALAADPSPAIRRLAERCWPGPLTMVLARSRSALALELGGDPGTVGLRCPDHALVQAVAEVVGPIAVTSANRHGEPTPTTAAEAAASLARPPALVVDGGELAGTSSTVVDLTGPEPKVLRAGPIPAEVVVAILAES